MSEPVTNEEVEDVLSSIRRLVSEDKRPLAGLRSASAEAVPMPEAEQEPAPEVVDRFVLTPALRVTDQQDVAAVADDAGPLDLGSVARNTWAEDETVVAENEPMMLFPAAQEASAEAGAQDGDTDIAALVHEAVETQEQSSEDLQDEGDYSDESYWETPELAEPAQVHEESAEHMHAQEHSGDADADWNVDENDRYSSDLVEEDAHEADFHTIEEVIVNDAPEAVFEAPAEAPNEAANASVLTDKIAALEAAVGEIAQDWEPDGEIEEELTSTVTSAMAWEDNVDLDATGEPIHAAFDDAPLEAEEIPEEPHADSDAGEEEPLMDEAALRDLVSEIVRAELQGALGERITRNVRKLVRREIHRALTAQDME
ncbi:hypothetical protein [Sulfitobacter donghicola]|uniref:Uncharacterized protein n=1 Tax=Sulfitobacter donghicola DSW-25 = KCTC 12864 = JCM 14565 TaxID=1300350 RepID=A0A073II08_9RHOB|nr:hypothetical protein [Sulfitobacter donghicola]KEJ89195.1 hypothetical protein DSW25_09180 [Sulfitobacter donghicola DSW-25 = KCTC 12864 = JCM 14565]KIN68985.1 Glycerol-3-phosphate dehydrogenase [Sulfitobacter donghicola DSW-25 = KCTC 12864 = JCM 14565]